MSNEQLLTEIARLQEELRATRAAQATTSSTSSNAAVTNDGADGVVAVNRIGIKIGPFWKRDPTLWFAQLEAQFTLAGITREDTRYY